MAEECANECLSDRKAPLSAYALRDFAKVLRSHALAQSDAEPLLYEMFRRNVLSFAQAILHGDDEHKAWLMEAAEAFASYKPLPPTRGKGTDARAR
jgi:hypothetical protein